MSEENKNLNTISEDTANADSNAVAETADKKEDTKAKKNKKNKSKHKDNKDEQNTARLQWQLRRLLSLW